MKAIVYKDFTMVDFTPTSTVEAGDVVVQGDLVGVAVHKIEANQLGALLVNGQVSVVKGSGAISAGALVYWDATNQVATTTATGNKLMGKAVRAAASGDARVLVLLTP